VATSDIGIPHKYDSQLRDIQLDGIHITLGCRRDKLLFAVTVPSAITVAILTVAKVYGCDWNTAIGAAALFATWATLIVGILALFDAFSAAGDSYC
jgi:hypothetical protein